MRISDWSSDVCPSDLGVTQAGGAVAGTGADGQADQRGVQEARRIGSIEVSADFTLGLGLGQRAFQQGVTLAAAVVQDGGDVGIAADLRSVGKGKCVSACVEPGGWRALKKKTKK